MENDTGNTTQENAADTPKSISASGVILEAMLDETKVKANLMRMAPWLVIAVASYTFAFLLAKDENFRQLSTILWKVGNVTIAAYLGYWVDRHLFDRIDVASSDLLHIRRAIVVGSIIIAIGLGL